MPLPIVSNFSCPTQHSLLRALLLCLCLWMALGRSSFAAPTLTVSNIGPNLSGNLEWLVEVAPDPALFTLTDLGLGGSLAVELAFEVVNSDLLSVSVNNADWPLDIAGNNPFSRGVSSGVSTDFANDTVFAALLSDFFIAGNDVTVLTIETSGIDCTGLTWGGHTVLEGTVDEYESSLIAQAGQNFTGYTGSLAEPNHDGDFDIDCDVDGTDLLAWQENYGSPYNANDLTDWQTNYGSMTPVSAVSTAVPEPNTLILVSIFCIALAKVRPVKVQRR